MVMMEQKNDRGEKKVELLLWNRCDDSGGWTDTVCSLSLFRHDLKRWIKESKTETLKLSLCTCLFLLFLLNFSCSPRHFNASGGSGTSVPCCVPLSSEFRDDGFGKFRETVHPTHVSSPHFSFTENFHDGRFDRARKLIHFEISQHHCLFQEKRPSKRQEKQSTNPTTRKKKGGRGGVDRREQQFGSGNGN